MIQPTQSCHISVKWCKYGHYKKTLLGFLAFVSSSSGRYHEKHDGLLRVSERTWRAVVLQAVKNTAHGLNYIKFMSLWHNSAIFKFTTNEELNHRDISISVCVYIHTRHNPIIVFTNMETQALLCIEKKHSPGTFIFPFFLIENPELRHHLLDPDKNLMWTNDSETILSPCSSSSSISQESTHHFLEKEVTLYAIHVLWSTEDTVEAKRWT
mgnify:CR=1 FL=1